MTTQTAIERQAAANPLLIGALTGLVAPAISGIYAIRHRKPMVFFGPMLVIVVWAAVFAPFTEGDARLATKRAAQVLAGVTAAALVVKNKKQAQDELNNA